MGVHHGTDGSGLYAEFRKDLLASRTVHSVRTTSLVVLTTNVAFMWLDHYIFPELFWAFFAARMVLNAFLLVLATWACHRFPEGAQIALAAATGTLLLWVVHGVGALSGYYVGLLLLFSGLPMLLPLSTLQNLVLCTGMVFVYAVLAAIASQVDWDSYAINVLFLSSAAFISVANCQQLNRSRFRDFCQRREIETARDRLADLDKAKSRFTANIHHELRTPLTLMLAPIEAMRSGDMGEVPSGLDRTLRIMQSNGLRLLKLINNLLDLAKVESDQLSVRRVPVELGRLVQEIVDGALPMAERKGLELRAEGFEAVPLVNLDPDALEKVLVNLIGNALKFTDAGGITVRGNAAGAGEVVDEAGHSLASEGIHMVVEDTGVGLPADQLARVFDRFAQVDGSSTRKHEGTGIGLSLVQELVSLHGGQVWATSEGDGQGAQMHVLLPLGEADDDPEEEVLLEVGGERALSAAASFKALASEVSMDLEESGDGRFAAVEHTVSRWEATRHGDEWLAELPEHPADTPEVVIAEDNAEMRRLLAFLVGREFRVRPTRNGREALEAVRERAPALVLTDVMMPEMSGTELCQAIKEDEALRGVPVMLVTSKAEREMKIEGLELGADDYVTKPFHPRELLARTRSLVRIRTLQQELAERNEALQGSNQELAETLEELKEAEVHLVQAERLAAVGELSAGVAHEVNNPLNFARNSLAALRTYVDDLQGLAGWLGELNANDPGTLRVQLIQLQRKKQELGLDEMAGELAELIGIVTEGLDRTARLVSDLQTFASPGQGEQGIVDVAGGLRSTLQLLAHRLREAGVEAELEVEAGLATIPGDAGGLNQVFLNLLKNAIEAFEGREGRISVRARMAEGELEVCVEDTGPGIEAELQARLFEPFFSTKGAGEGSGLGLSMCQRIVRGHGGRIEISSEPGEGTQVRVRLPVAPRGGDDAGSG